MSKPEEPSSSAGAEANQARDAAGAVDDLTHGLDLILRAARKAVRGIDPRQIEELGHRAKRSLEDLNRDRVLDFGRRAAQSFDPKKIEEIANEAGRELLNVVERVAERVDGVVGRGKSYGREPPSAPAEPAPSPPSGDQEEKPPRVRVEDKPAR